MTKVIYIWADIINKVDISLWVHQDYKERLFNLIPSQDTLQGLNILWSAQTDHTLLYLMALFQLSKYIHIYMLGVYILKSACWPKKNPITVLLKSGIPTLLINAGCLNFNVYLQSKILSFSKYLWKFGTNFLFTVNVLSKLYAGVNLSLLKGQRYFCNTCMSSCKEKFLIKYQIRLLCTFGNDAV